MRIWGVALLVACGAVAAWFWLSEQPAPGSSDDSADEAATPTVEPVLEGADELAQQEHARREEERAEARLLARRGEGGSGFLKTYLSEGAFGVSGRLLGSDGKPIEESEASLTGDDEEHDGVFVDPDGRFVVEYGYEHPMRLVLTAPGYAPWVGPWRRYKNGEHIDVGTVTLQRGLTIAGKAVDQHGEPVTQGEVSLVPDDDPMPAWWRPTIEASGAFWSATTLDESGAFELDGLHPGRYRVRVNSWDTEDDAILEGVQAGRTDLVIRVQIPEEPDAEPEEKHDPWTVLVEIHPEDVEAASGPSGGMSARRNWDGLEVPCFGEIDRRHYSVTNHDGRLEIEVRGPGPLEAVLDDHQSGFAPTFVRDLHRGGPKRVVRLDRGVTLKGRITGVPPAAFEDASIFVSAQMLGDGSGTVRPLEDDVRVGPYWRTGWVDAQGNFEVRGMLPGTARLSLQSKYGALVEKGKVVRHVSVQVGSKPLRLKGFAYPTVEVLCTVPKSHAHERLQWTLEDRSPLGGYELDEGEAQLLGTRAAWRLVLSEHGGDHALFVQCRGQTVLGPTDVRIPAGATRVTVNLEPAQLLEGRVVDAAGAPVPRAYVELRPAEGALPFEPVRYGPPPENAAGEPDGVVAGLDGTFTMTVPRSGAWKVFVTADGKSMAEEPQPAKPGPMTVRMSDGYRITGRLSFPKTMDWGGAYVITAWPHVGDTPRSVQIEGDGFFELEALPQGRYTLTAHPSYEEESEMEGGYGEVKNVEAGARGVGIEIRKGQTARLDLVDAKGTRLAGVRVLVRGTHRLQRVWPEVVSETDGVVVRPFGVYSLGPGAHRFEFTVPGKGSHSVPVKPGETVRYVVR